MPSPFAHQLCDDAFGARSVEILCDDSTALPGACCRTIADEVIDERRARVGADADFVVCMGGTNDLADIPSLCSRNGDAHADAAAPAVGVQRVCDDLAHMIAAAQACIRVSHTTHATALSSAVAVDAPLNDVGARTLVLTVPDTYPFDDAAYMLARADLNAWIVDGASAARWYVLDAHSLIPWSRESGLWAVSHDERDGLHMSAAGYDRLGELVFDALKGALAERVAAHASVAAATL